MRRGAMQAPAERGGGRRRTSKALLLTGSQSTST
ncbi:hypothetical protein PVAP13_1KG265400 [Panicum virgatum]|uniref:Uncharacterized protein n=1 Tax=Panicum virgatum TaxID=38727 RepID=A0A8T0XHI6_PANVG|nr:hypothetical protein PVAP13_1KG265400 [Panicum virgatum]